MKTITSENGVIGQVDETATLAGMKHFCPNFFRNKHGKRETYTTYRGQMIVRNSVQFGGPMMPVTRHTAVYLFLPDDANFSCISAGANIKSVAQAKKLIDKVLDGGKTHYGMTL